MTRLIKAKEAYTQEPLLINLDAIKIVKNYDDNDEFISYIEIEFKDDSEAITIIGTLDEFALMCNS
jgi:hypothetical protein